MTGLGILLFLAGIGVLIFGILRFRKRNWPRRKTQIVIISSILAIIIGIGIGIIPTAEDEAATEEPKQEETTKTIETTPLLEAETTFTTDDEGTLIVEGKTNPGAVVALDLVDLPDAVTTAGEDGAFRLSVTELDKAQDAVLSIAIDGQTKEQTLKLAVTPAYETKLAAKAEATRVAAEKAEAERVERERVAAEEKRAADAKVAAEKKAEEARVASEKKAAEAKRASAERAAAQPDTSNEQGQMVYITATGKKYHYNQNCRGLNNSNGETAVTVSEAKAQGLTLCKFEQ
ncbi:hypothetical protein QJV15_09595 [Listeria cossartiae subsp. cayugensis]|uniref:hypothetical protein n=1 Tax=Listeria cossartiae TaxID=2838249 RepID=UPI0028807341|nr:hypothetical protein [Listeria cossartiae]MDT0001121.1 hypothetical protein [Listeria cossartiae subsp. cayugensis]MDT0009657.1 hypothetical protein [Listeria cossartiae subsp. cayugensis]MDT0031151.1 hypothetical protein [Listeria cossartiae subsp. cayugensis]MDT0039267.1 hypothetical protein [Listeria cossartiae subsp. cayugensis]MDT0044954.1 hypothetical protein [Listeria cossartiae subsp. cayugensis]